MHYKSGLAQVTWYGMALTTEERDNAMPFLGLEHGRLAVSAQGCKLYSGSTRGSETDKNRVRAEL